MIRFSVAPRPPRPAGAPSLIYKGAFLRSTIFLYLRSSNKSVASLRARSLN